MQEYLELKKQKKNLQNLQSTKALNDLESKIIDDFNLKKNN